GAWEGGILAFTKALIALRRTQPVLSRGEVRVVSATGSMVSYLRSWTDRGATQAGRPSPLLVALNNGEGEGSLVIQAPELAGARWSSEPLPGMGSLPDLVPS